MLTARHHWSGTNGTTCTRGSSRRRRFPPSATLVTRRGAFGVHAVCIQLVGDTKIASTLHALRCSRFPKNGEDSRSASGIKSIFSDSRDDFVVRRHSRVLPGFFAIHKLEVIAYLTKPQNLLQNADVILHYFVLLGQIVELSLRFREKAIVDFLHRYI